MGVCGYKLDINTDDSPVTVDVVSPEGTTVSTVTGDTVEAAISAAAPIIDQDIQTFGCNAPWST